MLEEKKGRKREKQTNKRKLPAIGSRPRRSNCLPLKRKKKERRSHNRLDTWNTNLGIARDLRQIVRNNRRPEARGTNSGESRKRQEKRRSTFRTVDPELLSGGCETTIRTKKRALDVSPVRTSMTQIQVKSFANSTTQSIEVPRWSKSS